MADCQNRALGSRLMRMQRAQSYYELASRFGIRIAALETTKQDVENAREKGYMKVKHIEAGR